MSLLPIPSVNPLNLLGPYKPVVILVAVLLFVAGVYYKGYANGAHNVQADWDLANARTEKIIADLKERAGKITTVEVVKYVDRVKTVQVKGDTITEYVDRVITKEANANCTIPKNFILLHNNAVKNTVPAGVSQ